MLIYTQHLFSKNLHTSVFSVSPPTCLSAPQADSPSIPVYHVLFDHHGWWPLARYLICLFSQSPSILVIYFFPSNSICLKQLLWLRGKCITSWPVSPSFAIQSLPPAPFSPISTLPLFPFRKEQAFPEYQLNMAFRFFSQLTLDCVKLTIKLYKNIFRCVLAWRWDHSWVLFNHPTLSVIVPTRKARGVSHHYKMAKLSDEVL